MNSNVFVSYSSIDEHHAKLVAAALAELGVDYFLDRKDIEWGDDITDKIGSGLATCSELLVILSPASLKSQWVPFEIGQAAALGKKILPFLTHPSLDIPGYLRKFHYKANIEDVKRYFTPKSIQSLTSNIIAIVGSLRECNKFDTINLELGHILHILGDDLASGIPLLLVEQRFFSTLGFRFASGSHFDAEKLYEKCFVELWNYPEMNRVIGRLVVLGLVYRPSGSGEYTLTDQGASVLNHLRLQSAASYKDIRAILSRTIANMVPVLSVSEILMPDTFKPKLKVDLHADISETVKRIERMCASEGFTYRGYFVDTGFIARRKTDNKLVFIDLASERISQPFEKVLDDVVLNDDSGTYYLRITVNGHMGTIYYASAEISMFSSDLDGTEKTVSGFCLDTRSERPLIIRDVGTISKA